MRTGRGHSAAARVGFRGVAPHTRDGRASLKTLNRSFDGMTYGSPIHTRLAEQLAAKQVENELAAPDGSIDATSRRAGPPPEEVRDRALESYGGPPLEPSRDMAFDPISPTSMDLGKRAIPEDEFSNDKSLTRMEKDADFNPYDMVGGPPVAMPEGWTDQWRDELEPDPDPFGIGMSSIGVAEPLPAPNEVRLKILGISGHIPGVNHKDLAGILDDIERLPDLSPEQVDSLRQRVDKLDDGKEENGKLVRFLRTVE